MEKSTIILATTTLCFLSFFGTVYGNDRFQVEGVVYCDTCRTQFLTKLSEFLEGATVRVQCREENGTITFSKEAVTDAKGSYKVEIDGDHEDDVCDVVLVKSPRKDCSEINTDSHLQQAARISITKNNGIVSSLRSANPLGFLKNQPLPGCSQMLRELGINEDGTLI